MIGEAMFFFSILERVFAGNGCLERTRETEKKNREKRSGWNDAHERCTYVIFFYRPTSQSAKIKMRPSTKVPLCTLSMFRISRNTFSRENSI